MKIEDVKKDIKSKSPKTFYIFTGEEVGIRDIYINKIAEIIGTKPKRYENMKDCIEMVTNQSFLSTRMCCVIQDDAEFLKAEDSWHNFSDDNIQGDNIVILTYNTLDKRSKFYKAYKDTIVVFERLKTALLTKYAQQKIDLSVTDCETLIGICENDYSRMLHEIDKIKTFSTARNISTSSAMLDLIRDGTIYLPPEDAIFDFVNAVLKRQKIKAFDLYEECKEVGESNMALLSVLFTSAKQVYQVQGTQSDDMAKTTGLTPYQVKCARENSGHYSLDELKAMLRCIQYAEKSIKTGMMEESVAIDYVLVHVL